VRGRLRAHRPGEQDRRHAAQRAHLRFVALLECDRIDQDAGLAGNALDEVPVVVEPPLRGVLAPHVDLRRDLLHRSTPPG
jgi:hypothetical protein